MSFEMYALAAVALYALAGIAYSSRLRCWARGHDEMTMYVKTPDAAFEKTLMYHCRWCLNRRPYWHSSYRRDPE